MTYRSSLLALSLFCVACDPTGEPEGFPELDYDEIEITEPVTYIRPEQFPAAERWDERGLVLSLPALKRSETVSIISVHASQLDYSPADSSLAEVPFYIQMSANGLAEPTGSTRQAISGEPSFAAARGPRSDAEVWRQGMEVVRKRKLPGRSSPGRPFGKCKGPYLVGETVCEFLVHDGSQSMAKVAAVLRHESAEALFFVDPNDIDLTDADLAEIAGVLHERSMPGLNRYFGPVPDRDGNGKFIVLFSSLLKNIKVNGYVSPWDLLPQGDDGYWASNEADIVYLNTPSGTQEWALDKQTYLTRVIHQTLAHETKHLIASGSRFAQASDTSEGFVVEKYWLEESTAMAAVELCGIGMPSYTQPKTFAEPALLNPESVRIAYSLYPDTYERSIAMYAFNMLFLWRVAEQVGHDSFWKQLTWNEQVGVRNVENAAASRYAGFAEMMLDFGMTLFLDGTRPPEAELQGYDFLAPQIDLRDGSWSELGVRPIGEETGAGGKAIDITQVHSFAFHQGKGAGQDARVVIRVPSVTARPYFIVLRR